MNARSIVILALLCLVATTSVRADSMSDCNNKKSADRKVRGCSEVIAATHMKRGRAYFVKKELERAISDFSTSNRLSSDLGLNEIRDEAYGFRAMSYLRGGRPDLALADIKKGIRLTSDPGMIKLLKNFRADAVKALGARK